MAHYQGYRFFDGVDDVEMFISLLMFGTIEPPPDKQYNRNSEEHVKGTNSFDPSYGNRIIGFRTRY